MLKTTVIVPTYNRPDELKKLITSLLCQTVLPDELIIVDDGNLTEIPLKAECRKAGINAIYLKKDTPGLTASRNAGIKFAQGDIIHFFDDDVVLTPQYIEKITKVYTDDIGRVIGGVSGRDMNVSPTKLKNRLRRVLDIVFLISGFSEGKALPSGFFTEYGATGRESGLQREVDFLPGCSFSFRKEVFHYYLFDTQWFLNYGMGEDKDFSYRVSLKYKLIYEPSAELMHNRSPLMRPDYEKLGRMYVLFMYIFFKRYRGNTLIRKFLFTYALTGYLFSKTLLLVIGWELSAYEYLKGLFKALYAIAREDKVMVK